MYTFFWQFTIEECTPLFFDDEEAKKHLIKGTTAGKLSATRPAFILGVVFFRFV